MFDLRIYRAALIPALAALIVMMFSLQARPDPLTADLAPDAFDAQVAAIAAREIVRKAPDRRAGSPGDREAARIVAQRFGLAAGGGGKLLTQRFDGEFEGRSTTLSNVVLVLPGQSDERVVILAHRDSRSGPGATRSAASTGALIEIAQTLAQSRLRKTFVLVSTDGGEAGGLGARTFARRFPGAGDAESAIVIDNAGAAKRSPPFLMPWSAGSTSASMQLVQSAKSAIRRELAPRAEIEGAAGHLLRLALPIGIGEQSVLLARGIEAVTISPGGELGPPRSLDGVGDLSSKRLGPAGRAVLSLALALDSSPGPPAKGPSAYAPVAGRVLPGWAIAVLSLALLIAPLVAAVDALARARRRREPVLPWLRWTLAAASPFVVAAVLAYVLALLGWIPSPTFPYDPRAYPFGATAAVTIAALAATVLVAWLYLRPALARVEGPATGDVPAAAVTLVLVLTLLMIWSGNPYTALLLVPAAHLWVIASLPELRQRPRVVAAIALAGLIPPLVGVAYVASKTDSGFGVAWQLVLMTTGGHVGPVAALWACILAGCLVAALAVAAARHQGSRSEPWTDM